MSNGNELKNGRDNGKSVTAGNVEDRPMLGRLVVTMPQFGELRVYGRPDGTVGAKFYSETGTQYGTTKKIKELFAERGNREGWAWPNPTSSFVFAFKPGRPEDVAAHWVSIRNGEGHVNLPPRLHNSVPAVDGLWVAYYARATASRAKGTGRTAVTAVFEVNVQRPSLVGRLGSQGALKGQDHIDPIRRLLGELEANMATLNPRILQQWPDALVAIAAVTGLPAEMRALAGALRTRLLRRTGPSEGGLSGGQAQQPKPVQPSADSGGLHGVQRMSIDLS